MPINCPTAGSSVAAKSGGGGGSGSGSGSGTICAHGAISASDVTEVRVRTYSGHVSPPASDSSSASPVALSSGQWCASGLGCNSSSSSPGAPITVAAFEMNAGGMCINVLSATCYGLNSTVGGTDCCTSGPCGSGSGTGAYGGNVLVAKGSTFPPPPPPMSAYKQA